MWGFEPPFVDDGARSCNFKIDGIYDRKGVR